MKLELMAPAGNPQSFVFAIEKGADSVYLGLKYFNARKPAKNFSINEFKRAVEYAHSKKRKVYLALNIDIKTTEIKQILQILSLSSQTKVDAVIVKDLGVIYLIKKFFKNINIHLSTQCAISSVWGNRYAEKIGASRVVLARELELSEIKEIADNTNIEVEIFTEGSMCFSVSGRCLMSSWVGGKSGNRGVCTAPCRVLWMSKSEKNNFFSMKDLRLLSHLRELSSIGVDSVKIEGRLKKPQWVGEIVDLYRKAIDSIMIKKQENETESAGTKELAKFSAREVAEGHLFSHSNLIGVNQEWENYLNNTDLNKTDLHKVKTLFERKNEIIFSFSGESVNIKINWNDITTVMEEKFKIKHSKAKLISFDKLINDINTNKLLGYAFIAKIQGEPTFISSSALQKIKKNIIAKIQTLIKKQESLPPLDINMAKYIEFDTTLQRKREKLLGSLPNKAIINSNQISSLLTNDFLFDKIVVSLSCNLDIKMLYPLKEKYNVILSIPDVLYNKEASRIFDILKKLQKDFKRMEANSFTGMQMLTEFDVKKEAGAGLAVLNHIAAKYLYDNGYESVYAFIEGDIKDYRFLSEICSGKIDAMVFAKLPLFISRVEATNFINGNVFKDNYNVEIECNKMAGINYFVSTKPFSLIDENIKKEKIYFDNLVVDFRFFKNPFNIYNKLLKNSSLDTSTFNFYRKLY